MRRSCASALAAAITSPRKLPRTNGLNAHASFAATIRSARWHHDAPPKAVTAKELIKLPSSDLIKRLEELKWNRRDLTSTMFILQYAALGLDFDGVTVQEKPGGAVVAFCSPAIDDKGSIVPGVVDLAMKNQRIDLAKVFVPAYGATIGPRYMDTATGWSIYRLNSINHRGPYSKAIRTVLEGAITVQAMMNPFPDILSAQEVTDMANAERERQRIRVLETGRY